MTDDNTNSRRGVLRLAGAVGLGIVGLSGAASADGKGKNGQKGKNGKHNGRKDDKRNGRKNGKNGQKGKNEAPDPVTDTDAFVEHTKREATRGLRK
jgi:hypothetical protein